MVYADYIHNCFPSFVINNKYPYQIWYNRLPVVQHFRVFSSLCYAFIPKHQCNKLGAKSCKCIFFGYSATSKYYKLYDEENNKFIISRDVIFLDCDKYNSIVD